MIFMLSALMALASVANADTPAPFYPRQFNTNQSLGAINQNLSDMTGRNTDKLVPIVGDQACAPGQSLTGATEKGGYIFGGTCTAATSSSSNTFTGNNTFTGTNIFNGIVSISTWSAAIITPSGASNSTFGGCSASTQTITLVGSTVTIWGSGGISVNAAVPALATVLEDGKFIGTETNTVGIGATQANGAAMNFIRVYSGRTSGQHNYCVGFWVIGSGTVSANTNIDFQFGVREETLK